MTWNVLYCSDNNYAPYLGVSIQSLLENNKSAESIVFYVVSDNISDDNIERLKRQIAKHGDSRRLVLIDGRQWVERMTAMNILPYRGGHAANLRLFFIEYVEKNMERLLYLDCDTLVCGDLSELFEQPLNNSTAAVVLDSLSGKEYKTAIGFDSDDRYFNSGMVLFDVKKWIENDCQQKLIEYMNDPQYNFPNNDQDFLNLLLKDDKIVVSPKYNFQTTHAVYSNRTYFASYPSEVYYTNSEIDEARNAPVILHAYRFLGQFPWHKDANHPWRQIFWDYVAKSEWQDLEPRENQGGIFAVERIAFKIIPKGCFLPIFKKIQVRSFKKRMSLQKKNKEASK